MKIKGKIRDRVLHGRNLLNKFAVYAGEMEGGMIWMIGPKTHLPIGVPVSDWMVGESLDPLPPRTTPPVLVSATLKLSVTYESETLRAGEKRTGELDAGVIWFTMPRSGRRVWIPLSQWRHISKVLPAGESTSSSPVDEAASAAEEAPVEPADEPVDITPVLSAPPALGAIDEPKAARKPRAKSGKVAA